MKTKPLGSRHIEHHATTTAPVAIFWFRRDLRLADNVGLAEALRGDCPVVPLFVFDPGILDRLEDEKDRRVELIRGATVRLAAQISERGGGLAIERRDPVAAFRKICGRFNVRAVYTNHDYEPYARERDAKVAAFLQRRGVALHGFKDQVIFEKLEVEKGAGGPYTVFTPYSRKWKSQLTKSILAPHEGPRDRFFKWNGDAVPALEELGFQATGDNVLKRLEGAQPEVRKPWLDRYGERRNFPALDATSKLGPSLRFGLVSVRKLVRRAQAGEATWLGELIWREFFMQILWNFPHVVEAPFKPAYAKIKWRNDEDEFRKWCAGRTGYPIVDAGMRELNETGYMHNRVRMIAASFLVKHLLIDWRWGERYFASKLIDFELASNNGNWQWVAGSGCDAAPYFRVFNPETQAKKFDRDGAYVRTWVPAADLDGGLEPMISHIDARLRVLRAYRAALVSKG